MAAFVILDVEVIDPELYAEYRAQTAPSIEQYGGRYAVRGGGFTVVEGEWDLHRMVILEFPDLAAAHAWHSSPEYTPLRALRQRATRTRAVIVEGTQAPV